MLYTVVAALALLLSPASAFAPPASLVVTAPRTAVMQRHVVMIAKSEEEKLWGEAPNRHRTRRRTTRRKALPHDGPDRGEDRGYARTPTSRVSLTSLATLNACYKT